MTPVLEGFAYNDGPESLEQPPVLTADADTATGVGSYAIRMTGGEDRNYRYVLANAGLTVEQRPITIQADDKEMAEDGDTPEFTWTVKEGSIVNGDVLSGSLKADGTGAGKHSIVEAEPFANPNYAVTFLPGTLTVTEKPKQPENPDPGPTPPTGDGGVIPWLAALLTSGGMLVCLSLRRRKQNQNEDR